MKNEDTFRELKKSVGTDPLGMAYFPLIPEKYHKYLTGINSIIFFAVILCYHVAIIFQGVDLLDEGFHATLYQRIFDDPTSVQYGFFYWFSGIVGGLVLKVAPGLGLWGLRFAGALVSLSTIFVSFRLLKNLVPRGIWQISIVLLVLYINNEPKDIHYNTLSALLYFLAAWLMFSGLRNRKGWMLVSCGALISLNIFTRLPNILGIGIVAVIIFEAILTKRKFSEVVSYVFLFILGLVVTTLSIVGIMKAMGHFNAYTDSLEFLFSLSTSSAKKDGLAGSYSPFRMITLPVRQHFTAILTMIFLLSIMVIGKVIADQLQKISRSKLRADVLMWLMLSTVVLLVIFTERIVLKDLTYLFTGFCTLTAFIYILGSFSYEEKLLSFLGLFIMLVHPLGSAPGIMTVMIYSLWLSFPLGVKMLADLFSQNIILHGQWGSFRAFTIRLEQRFLHKAMLWITIMVITVCIRHIIVYPYFFDRHNRFKMYAGINSSNMRFIYTSKARASVLNDLLEASSKYIKKGETVLAFDAFPMYHFMTETRPFLSSSAPLYFTTGHFEKEMSAGIKKTGLPIVIRQKIWMVHEGSTWPETIFKGENLQDGLSKGRNEIFNQFLTSNRYYEVWSNQVFSILLPGSRMPQKN